MYLNFSDFNFILRKKIYNNDETFPLLNNPSFIFYNIAISYNHKLC